MKTFSLKWASVSESDLDLLMSSCGTLESLSLVRCRGIDKIVVHAPKLLKLEVFVDIGIPILIEDAPSIREFHGFLWSSIRHNDVEEDDRFNLFQILMNFPLVEDLTLVLYYEPSLNEGNMSSTKLPQHLPLGHLLQNLRTLRMALCLSDAYMIATPSSLISSAPNLHKLTVYDYPYGSTSEINNVYWERHQVADCMKQHLSIVNLEYPNLSCEPVHKFIKFLLMNSCVLKRMTVRYSDVSLNPSLVEDLQSVQCASHQVVIEVYSLFEKP